jgi:beta-lactamase class A
MWGLDLRDADTGEVLAQVNAERVMDIASIGKLLLLAVVAEGICSRTYDAHEVLSRGTAQPVGDSGLWQHMAHVDELTVHDAALLIAAVSDNLATNVLMGRVGLDSTDRMAEELGLQTTRMHDMVREFRSAQDPRSLSTSSAGDLVELALHLHGSKDVLSSEACSLLRHWLGTGVDLSMVANSLNLDPLAHFETDHSFMLWNKTGTDIGVRADVGVITGPMRSVAYAAIANWSGDDAPDNALAVMRDIGVAIRNVVTVTR